MAVPGQEQSLGRVRVASFSGPGQVAPGTNFSMSLDVEYEVRTTLTVQAAVYSGASNAGPPLWQSESVSVSGGGDKVWTINSTAPSVEGTIGFSAYAYYLDNGTWKFYNDPVLGPGYGQITIKVSKYANLQVDTGIPDLVVVIGNASDTTGQTGAVNVRLAVGVPYLISVPSDLEFQNSTRIVFNAWQDGNNQSVRSFLLSGDMTLVGSYRHQYLLKATTNQAGSSYQKWCDVGTNVTLREADFAPNSSFLTAFGGKYVFSGWSGDVNSRMNEINLTMDSPKSVTANFSTEYGYLIIIPIVVASGIIGEIVLLSLRRRRGAQPNEMAHNPTCPNCGRFIEQEWAHCIHCGSDLSFPENMRAEA
jgi:hypothetical protein